MDEKKKVQRFKISKWYTDWSKLNFSLYFKEFNFYIFCWLFVFIAVIILFHKPLQQFFNFILVTPILSTCPKNLGVDFVFISIAFVSLSFFFRQLYKHLLPTTNSLLFGFSITVLYIIFIKNSNLYKFYHFSHFFTNTTYASVFLISILPLLFTYKAYMNPLTKKPTKFSLIDDSTSVHMYEDIYERTNYAISVAKHILHTSSDSSFAIGVIGDWGTGKSDFLKRLKTILEKDNENIIFEFNPWRVNKTDSIIDEFFKAFSNKLKPYNQSITGTINDYSNRILKPASETHLKFVDALIGSWFQNDDIQDKYNTINESIKATSKRIVVFIDDVDRLTGKEVMEILRIIRNTANFANTFFIVGLDQNYIVNVLKNTKDFFNEEEYLKKVFQLTITLPAFKKNSLIGEIKKNLCTPDLSQADRDKIDLALQTLYENTDDQAAEFILSYFTYETILEKMLDNVRDLKRFCNSFKIAFNILKDEADIHDLLILELIRNKNMELYNNIRNKSILKTEFDKPNQLILKNENWELFKNQLPEKDRDALESALVFLFNNHPLKNQRKLLYPHNFYIYFSYHLFNLISFHEFNETLQKSIDDIIQTFNKWIAEGKENELYQIISNLNDFQDSDSLRKFTVILLRIATPRSPWFEQVRRLIYLNWQRNQKKYFKSINERHKEFICSIFEEESIDSFTRASLAFQFLKGIRENAIIESGFFLKGKELRNLIYKLFDNYLNSNPNNPNKTIEYFYLNDYRIENLYVVRFPPACKRFKNYLLSNDDGLKGYTKILLRSSQIHYNGNLVLEPFIVQIFPNWKIFETKLANTEFDDNNVNRLKKILLNYLETYFNSGEKPFKISDQDDKGFVEKLLNLKESSIDED